MSKKIKIFKNILIWLSVIFVTALLLYNQYLIMINQGKAERIEKLREMMDNKREIINMQDTIIYQLKDSINELNYNEK